LLLRIALLPLDRLLLRGVDGAGVAREGLGAGAGAVRDGFGAGAGAARDGVGAARVGSGRLQVPLCKSSGRVVRLGEVVGRSITRSGTAGVLGRTSGLVGLGPAGAAVPGEGPCWLGAGVGLTEGSRAGTEGWGAGLTAGPVAGFGLGFALGLVVSVLPVTGRTPGRSGSAAWAAGACSDGYFLGFSRSSSVRVFPRSTAAFCAE